MSNSTPIVSLNPRALLTRDHALAERAMNRLSLVEQLQQVLAAPLDQREAVLLLSRQAPQLAVQLPVEEFWLTVTTSGEGEAIELMQWATPEQLQFCLDVECWQKDAWQDVSLLRWLIVIAACGETKVVEWWQTTDPELLILVMKRWVTVYMRSGDEEVTDILPWPRSEPPFTYDNVYYFQCNDVEVDRVLRPMMDVLARHELPRLRQIFDAVIGAVGAEQEEAAYEARERRLAENGFPPWEEAIAVYRRIPPEQWVPTPHVQSSDAGGAIGVGPQFPLIALADDDLLLRRVLEACDDSTIWSRWLIELARLSNRVVMADGHSITHAAVIGGARKAIGYVNIGLECVSDGDVARARTFLPYAGVTHLFQVGFSAVMQVAEQARLAWPHIAPTEASVPDDPVAAVPFERIRAATWKWPKYYVGPATSDGILHRDFQRVAELTTVQSVLPHR